MMISLNDFTSILANSFFDGSMMVAGLVIFAAVMLVIFALVRSLKTVLIMMMPVTLIFSVLGIISTDMMILLIIVAVLGLATAARDTWR